MASQKRLLISGIESLGLRIGKKELSALDLYTQVLLEWSGRINLTGHRDQKQIEIFHYLDSLSLFKTGLIQPGLSVLDVGSGAGFPGLPLKIFEPTLEMTLLEASEKRCFFLRYLARLLELPDVRVEVGQARDFARETEASFDLIVSRAVGSMSKISSWTVPILKPGGLILLQKSRKVENEIKENRKELQKLGLKIRETIPLSVPHLDRSRFVVVLEKN